MELHNHLCLVIEGQTAAYVICVMLSILCLTSLLVTWRRGWRAHIPSLQTTSSCVGPVDTFEGQAAVKRELQRGEEHEVQPALSQGGRVLQGCRLGLTGPGSSCGGWRWAVAGSELSWGQPCAQVSTKASGAWGRVSSRWP